MKAQSFVVGSGPGIREIESQPDVQPSLAISDQDIAIITYTRYLRIQIDSLLNLEKHIVSFSLSGTLSTKSNELCLQHHFSHFNIDLTSDVEQNLVHYPLVFSRL